MLFGASVLAAALSAETAFAKRPPVIDCVCWGAYRLFDEVELAVWRDDLGLPTGSKGVALAGSNGELVVDLAGHRGHAPGSLDVDCGDDGVSGATDSLQQIPCQELRRLGPIFDSPDSGDGRIADAALETDLLPDKKGDAWTTTSRFKRDLAEMFPTNRRETALELGAHVGHCTRVLAHLFGAVIAVEHSEAVLAQNVQHTKDLGNVVHLRLHTTLDDWGVFRHTSALAVVLVDAAHDYESVRSDLAQALALPGVHTVVLDDYGAERGVRKAVDEAVASGAASIQRYVGEPPPWTFAGRTVEYWEGIALRPLRPARGVEAQRRALAGSSWVVFPAGVFVSGYFQPHGTLVLHEGGVAASSYGEIAWRQASEHEIPGGEDFLVFQLEEEPRWRAEVQLNARRSAGVLFRDDGHQLVMLRQDMMRTVGEKLLSFMH